MTSGSFTRGSNTSAFYQSKTWSGTNDPVNHRKANPYTAYGRDQVREPTLLSTYDGTYSNTPSWTIFSADDLAISAAESAWTSNHELELLSRLAQSIRNTDFQAGTALAELPSTLRGVAETCKNVLGAAHAVKHGDFSGAVRLIATSLSGDSSLRRDTSRFIKYRAALPSRRSFEKRAAQNFAQSASRPDGFAIRPPASQPALQRSGLSSKNISDAWLALRYGWQPLITDVYDAMKWYESKTSAPRSLSFQASLKIPVKVANVNRYSSSPGLVVPAQGFASARITYTLTEPVSTARQLGLLDPASMAWEVTPFSFVADWFIPIGNYLELTSLFGSLTGSYVRSSYYVLNANSRAGSAYINNPPLWFKRDGGYVRATVWKTVRSIGTVLAVPKPTFKALDRALSIGHIENAAALIWSAVKRLR